MCEIPGRYEQDACKASLSTMEHSLYPCYTVQSTDNSTNITWEPFRNAESQATTTESESALQGPHVTWVF